MEDDARRAPSGQPPLLLLGVRRSGTTLFRVMLDRHPDVAIPDESYFIPQLADRHRGGIDVDRFVDDLRRLPTLTDWGVTADEVRARLRPGMPAGKAIAAVYEALCRPAGQVPLGRQDAAVHAVPRAARAPVPRRALPPSHPGRPRRRRLVSRHARRRRDGGMGAPALRRGLCGAVADGDSARPAGSASASVRTATSSFATRTWSPIRPSCSRRRATSRASPTTRSCSATRARWTCRRSRTSRASRVRRRPACATGAPSSPPRTSAGFESVAGDLLAELGYEVSSPAGPRLPARIRLARYSALTGGWRFVGHAVRRTGLWSRRHPPLDH